MKAAVKTIVNKAGFDIHRVSSPFVPFIRKFNYPQGSFKMWIGHRDAVGWYPEDWGLTRTATGWCERGEFKALAKLCGEGDRVLEIGAHHGFTGMCMALFVGHKGFVLGVEANPTNAMMAYAQLGLNPVLSNLQFMCAACSNVPGSVRITHDHNSSVTNMKDAIEVVAVTGDMLDEQKGPFDVLKVDVEGYEGSVLEGCTNMLSRTPKLALELHLDTLKLRNRSASDIFQLIHVEKYKGTMYIRPDFITLTEFNPARIPDTGIVNIFLEPKC